MERVIAADLVVGGDAVPLVCLEQTLVAFRDDEVDDAGGAARDRSLRALVEVVDARRAHKLELEVRVGIDAARHHVLAAGVDRPRAARDYQVAAELPVSRHFRIIYIGIINMLLFSNMGVLYFFM